MSAMRINLGVLVALVAVCAVHAQMQPVTPVGYSPYGASGQLPTSPPLSQSAPLTPMSPSMNSSPSSALIGETQIVSPSAQNWLNGSPCYCCGPVGAHGPIGAEAFVMTGPTLPAGGGTLAPRLHSGFMVEWGGRSLFFNSANDAAWTATLAVSYQINAGIGASSPFLFPTA